MKYLLLVLISLPAIAYRNQVPLSEAQRYIDAAPNGVAGLYECKDKPDEPCLSFDHIEGWDVAEIVETDGVYSLKNNETKLTEKLNKENVLKAKQLAKKASKEALKDVDIDGATTVAKLKAIVKMLLEAQE